jgi:hypothetical protein
LYAKTNDIIDRIAEVIKQVIVNIINLNYSFANIQINIRIMKMRIERLNKAYEHVRSLALVHTKKDFAAAIGFDKTNLSSAFKGVERYLTDGLFKKICDKYPDIFNVEYFLTGKGEMLKSESSIVGLLGANNRDLTIIDTEAWNVIKDQIQIISSQQRDNAALIRAIENLSLKPDTAGDVSIVRAGS